MWYHEGVNTEKRLSQLEKQVSQIYEAFHILITGKPFDPTKEDTEFSNKDTTAGQ